MSISDPLVKDAKGCVQQFLNLTNTSTAITDNNFYFILFCQTLEKIFNKGLIRQQNTKYFNRTIDAYAWMVSVAREKNNTNFTYQHCVDHVKARAEISTNEGRFRCLVKNCLMRKCLHIPTERLIESQIAHLLYSPNSILGDEILSEILLSVLRQVSKIGFCLDLSNCSFLDSNWYIPEIVQLELVPSKTLGIAVSFSGNKAVIVNLEPSGVIAESNKIKIGDVLDNLNGTHIDASCKGKLSTLMKYNKNKPITIRTARALNEETGEVYQPIGRLLKDLKIDLKSVSTQKADFNKHISLNKKSSLYGYQTKYLAEVEVGSLGNVKQVQKAIRCVLDGRECDGEIIKRFDKDVTLEIGEIGLKIRDRENGDIILEHPYMRISACGNLPFRQKLFGYCAGKENCDVANNFQCYIFESVSGDDTETILQSIGQGFHRTHYAV